jgi:hypothetical protein
MPKKKATTKAKVASKPAEEPVFGVVTYRMTYLWSETSTFSTILKIVVQGTIVQILDELPDNWSKVKTVEDNPVEGYIRTVFVGKAEG